MSLGISLLLSKLLLLSAWAFIQAAEDALVCRLSWDLQSVARQKDSPSCPACGLKDFCWWILALGQFWHNHWVLCHYISHRAKLIPAANMQALSALILDESASITEVRSRYEGQMASLLLSPLAQPFAVSKPQRVTLRVTLEHLPLPLVVPV